MNVLVLSASTKVLLVRSFRQAAAERGGRVIASDIAADSAALFAADEAILLPPSADPRFPEALLALCRAKDIRLVVPTRDGELAQLGALADELAKCGTTALLPPSEALATCQDKRRFSAFCQSLGLPVARIYAAGEMPPRFPVFARPVTGAGGRGARRINSAMELSALGDDPAMLVQDCVEDQEYTIDVLMDLEGRPVQAVARARLAIRHGEAQKSRVENIPALTSGALRLCTALGLIGHNVVQAFYAAERGAHFIEVNPRFGGASNLSIAAGLDSPRRILAMLAGDNEAACRERPIHFGLTMLRHSDDILLDAAAIAAMAEKSWTDARPVAAGP